MLQSANERRSRQINQRIAAHPQYHLPMGPAWMVASASHTRVRSAFEASRGEVDPLKVEALFSTARSELEALQTMCNNTFFKTFPGKGIGASASSPLGDLTQKSGSVRFSIFGKFWRS